MTWPWILRVLLPLTFIASAAAVDAQADIRKSTERHVAPHPIFDNKEAIKFFAKHCIKRPVLQSDRNLCDYFNERNDENLQALINCSICMEQIHSVTLSTTACGHVSHKSCRYQTLTKTCHECRGKGYHDDLGRSTIFREALRLFERLKLIDFATPVDLVEQDRLKLGYERHILVTGYEGLREEIYALEDATSIHFLPASPYQLLPQLRGVIEHAKISMDVCAKNVQLHLHNEGVVVSKRERTIRLANLLNLETDLEREVDFDHPSENVREWMLHFSKTLSAGMEEALPPADARVDHATGAHWYARLHRLWKIMKELPCDGYVDRNLVARGLYLRLVDAINIQYPSRYTNGVARETLESVHAAEKQRLIPEESPEDLRRSILAVVQGGGETFTTLWTEGRCHGDDYKADAGSFTFPLDLREKYVRHLKKATGYLSLPYAAIPRIHRSVFQKLAQIDIGTCKTTVEGLLRFNALLTSDLEQKLRRENMREHIYDWFQRIEGLRDLGDIPVFIEDLASTLSENSLEKRMDFHDQVEETTDFLAGWIDVSYFRT